MKKLTYCNICVLPSTKPHIKFDKNGNMHSLSVSYEKKSNIKNKINWKKRKSEFDKPIKKLCIKKPLSMTSAFLLVGARIASIVSHLLNRGLRILSVNIDYGIKTKNWRRDNLRIIPKLGSNLITYRPDLKLQKKLSKFLRSMEIQI